MENLIDNIKDIFFHFEEMGYINSVDETYAYSAIKEKINYNDLQSLYDITTILKNFRTNEKIQVYTCYEVSMVSRKSVLSFEDWTKVQTNLKTAILRLKDYDLQIAEKMTVDEIDIKLFKPLLKLKNIGELNDIRRKNHLLNLGRIDYTFRDNKITLRFNKMSNKKTIPELKRLLEEDFIVIDLTKKGAILNRQGKISGDQNNGYIFELVPKNINILA